MKEEKITTVCGSPDYLPGWIFQKEDGMYVRRAVFKGKKPGSKQVKILHFTDVHLNKINEKDYNNAEVMYSSQCREWNAGGISVKALEKAMNYGEQFDKIVITGDTLDYLTYGAMELMDTYIWDKNPDVMVAVGQHEFTRQMQTGLPDETLYEERRAIIERFWRHDINYSSDILEEKVMIIQMDNSTRQYQEYQFEKLEKDIALARAKDYIIFIFQHIPISTGKAADTVVYPILERYRPFNDFYNAVGHPDKAEETTAKLYQLLTSSADVIKGLFCGDYHNAYYTEVLASYIDENGEKQQTCIPQYVTEALVYDNYVGHVLEIEVD